MPWKTVFPTGATVTVYGNAAVPRAILHDWSWSDILFNAALSPVEPMAGGIAKFRAQRATQVAEQGLSGNEAVIAVIPDRAALAQSLGMASEAGASGAIFLLPSTGRDESGWSLRQLGHLEESDVRLTFRMEEASLVLCNGSRVDLPPRCEAANDRGYTLEVIADNKDWADAAKGDFFDLNGYKDEEKKDGKKVLLSQANKGSLSHPIVTPSHTAVTVPMANRLQLHFGFLRAGESLHTGFIRLTPGVELSTLQYRVLPIQKEWKPLD